MQLHVAPNCKLPESLHRQGAKALDAGQASWPMGPKPSWGGGGSALPRRGYGSASESRRSVRDWAVFDFRLLAADVRSLEPQAEEACNQPQQHPLKSP